MLIFVTIAVMWIFYLLLRIPTNYDSEWQEYKRKHPGKYL